MLYKITSRRKTVQSSKLMSLHSCEMAGYENLMVALGPVEKAEYLPKIDESTPPCKWNISMGSSFPKTAFQANCQRCPQPTNEMQGPPTVKSFGAVWPSRV